MALYNYFGGTPYNKHSWNNIHLTKKIQTPVNPDKKLSKFNW